MMLHTPMPYVGVRAIDKLANAVENLAGRKPDVRWQRLYVGNVRSEEHTSELQSLMRISYAVFCLKKQKPRVNYTRHSDQQPAELIRCSIYAKPETAERPDDTTS